MWPVLRELVAVGGLTLHEGRIWATNDSSHLVWLLRLDNNWTKWVHFLKIQILRHPQRVYFSDTWTGPTESVSFKKSPDDSVFILFSHSWPLGKHNDITLRRQKALEIYNFQFQLSTLLLGGTLYIISPDGWSKCKGFSFCCLWSWKMTLLPAWPHLSLPSHKGSLILCCNIFVYPLMCSIKYSSVVKIEAMDCLLHDLYFYIHWK